MSWHQFLRPDVSVFAIPIVAIIMGGVIAITRFIGSERKPAAKDRASAVTIRRAVKN